VKVLSFLLYFRSTVPVHYCIAISLHCDLPRSNEPVFALSIDKELCTVLCRSKASISLPWFASLGFNI
jgi:hypothetical protein